MKGILDNLIDKLNRKLTEARQDNPLADSVYGWFMFGKHKVSYTFSKNECSLDILNLEKETDHPNIESYCSTKCVCWSQIDVEDEPDEYDIHGFRNEADYINYKYG